MSFSTTNPGFTIGGGDVVMGVYPRLKLRDPEALRWATRELGSWVRDRYLSPPFNTRFSSDLQRLTRFWDRWVDLTTPAAPLSAVLAHLALVVSTPGKCWSLARICKEAGTFPEWVRWYERWVFGENFHVILPESSSGIRKFLRKILFYLLDEETQTKFSQISKGN